MVGQGTVQPFAADGGQLAVGARGDWQVALELTEPGAYTLTVTQPRTSGAVTWQDSKDFTAG